MSFAYVSVSGANGGQGSIVTCQPNIDTANDYVYWTAGTGILRFTRGSNNLTSFNMTVGADWVSNHVAHFNALDGYLYASTDTNLLIRQFSATAIAAGGYTRVIDLRNYTDNNGHNPTSVFGILGHATNSNKLFFSSYNGSVPNSDMGSLAIPGLTFNSALQNSINTQYNIVGHDASNGYIYAYDTIGGSFNGVLKKFSDSTLTLLATLTLSPIEAGSSVIEYGYDSKNKKIYAIAQYPSTPNNIILYRIDGPSLTQDTFNTISGYAGWNSIQTNIALDSTAGFIYIPCQRVSDGKFGVMQATLPGITFNNFVADGATGNNAQNGSGQVVIDTPNLALYNLRPSIAGWNVAKFSIDPPAIFPQSKGSIGAGLKKPNNIFDFNRLMGGY